MTITHLDFSFSDARNTLCHT